MPKLFINIHTMLRSTETDTSSFAFCRKWDAKPTMLVVSNMSPEEIVVDATGCLMEDEKNIEKAKVRQTVQFENF